MFNSNSNNFRYKKENNCIWKYSNRVCLGFLIFNLNPAKSNDGRYRFIIIRWNNRNNGSISKMPFIIVIIAIIPVLEAISVTLQVWYFKRTGKEYLKWHHYITILNYQVGKKIK